MPCITETMIKQIHIRQLVGECNLNNIIEKVQTLLPAFPFSSTKTQTTRLEFFQKKEVLMEP